MSEAPFHDPRAVASYRERARRAVPGFETLQALVDQLLCESVPTEGRLLVVGAGGGLETAHLAGRHAGWTFVGVDPSGPMLALARETLGPLMERVSLREGYVDGAPDGPFDGATCLLTLHFLPTDIRLATLREIHRRLRPGAPLVTFHHSVPEEPERTRSLTRYARYAAGPEGTPEQVAASAATLAERLPLLTPAADEDLLCRAGFHDPTQFFSALTLRGWVATA